MAKNNQPQLTPAQTEYFGSITPPKKTKNQRQSTQSHLQFSEIKDGIVVMRDGSLRMVVMCSPTNFDLKSPAERDAIEYAYQGFLNGLHFPIQIVIQSRKVDLDNYLENLENLQSNQPNGLLAGLMDDYIFNIRALLEEVNIMDKKFYVVVPYYTQVVSKENVFTGIKKLIAGEQQVTQTSKQYDQRRRDLIQRTNLVAGGLAQIGIRSVVLNTQEIIELYYNSYNIDEAQNQALGSVDQVNTPVVMREGGLAEPHGNEQPEPEPEDLFAAEQRRAQSGSYGSQSAHQAKSGERR
ncbi:hypothetical protein HYX70_03915 [Candidatus Saccharibacteria bacterium]|nr:hypothetical protein [Candidatus Saccharibacteria bacterium]